MKGQLGQASRSRSRVSEQVLGQHLTSAEATAACRFSTSDRPGRRHGRELDCGQAHVRRRRRPSPRARDRLALPGAQGFRVVGRAGPATRLSRSSSPSGRISPSSTCACRVSRGRPSSAVSPGRRRRARASSTPGSETARSCTRCSTPAPGATCSRTRRSTRSSAPSRRWQAGACTSTRRSPTCSIRTTPARELGLDAAGARRAPTARRRALERVGRPRALHLTGHGAHAARDGDGEARRFHANAGGRGGAPPRADLLS